MKSRSIFALAVVLVLSACSNSTTQSDIPVSPTQSSGQIYLYGEINVGSAKIIQNNNGVLENEIYSETFSKVIQRYWINL